MNTVVRGTIEAIKHSGEEIKQVTKISNIAKITKTINEELVEKTYMNSITYGDNIDLNTIETVSKIVEDRNLKN